jgi:hypothetical protein
MYIAYCYAFTMAKVYALFEYVSLWLLNTFLQAIPKCGYKCTSDEQTVKNY